jgi:hypothetical protein
MKGCPSALKLFERSLITQLETVAKLHSAQKGPDEKKSDEIAQQIGKYLKWNRNY